MSSCEVLRDVDNNALPTPPLLLTTAGLSLAAVVEIELAFEICRCNLFDAEVVVVAVVVVVVVLLELLLLLFLLLVPKKSYRKY